MFQVGQRVECVNAGFIDHYAHGAYSCDVPVVGKVYTVAGMTTSRMDGAAVVVLREIKNHKAHRCGYEPKRFRPLTEDPKRVEETMEKHFNKFLKERVSA